MSTRTVEVTQAHIANGRRADSKRCPVALALALGPDFFVGDTGLFWDCSGHHGRIMTFNEKTRRFIAMFDNRETVHPFLFEIEEDDVRLPPR